MILPIVSDKKEMNIMRLIVIFKLEVFLAKISSANNFYSYQLYKLLIPEEMLNTKEVHS